MEKNLAVPGQEEMSIDDDWVVDEDYFNNIPEAEFMDMIQKYPIMYNSSSKQFKNSRTQKLNALRAVAKPFRGNTDMVAKRFATIRTRVGRLLKAYRPSGSGTASMPTITPETKHLEWLFPFIKTRATSSNLHLSPLTPPSTEADNEEDEAVVVEDLPLESVESGASSNRSACSTPANSTPMPSKPWAKKRKKDSTNCLSDDIDKALLKKLDSEDDDILLFLRSLAPKMRQIPTHLQLDTQMEMMQLIQRKIKGSLEPPASSPYGYWQAPSTHTSYTQL